MQFTTSKLIEKRLTLSQEKDVKNLQCMVEEDPEETEEFKDPQMKEMQSQIFEFLKSSLLGNMADEEEGEEDKEEAPIKKGKKTKASKTTKGKKSSKAAMPEEEEDSVEEEENPEEDAEEPKAEARSEEPDLIPEAHLIVLQAESPTQPNFGILEMEQGFALGELVMWEETKMQVQFRQFKFLEKKEPVKIPAKTKIGIFSQSQLQNIITLDHDALLYANFGATLVLIENKNAIIFDQSPIYFKPGDKYVKEYFDKGEQKMIKENGLNLMIKTLPNP